MGKNEIERERERERAKEKIPDVSAGSVLTQLNEKDSVQPWAKRERDRKNNAWYHIYFCPSPSYIEHIEEDNYIHIILLAVL